VLPPLQKAINGLKSIDKSSIAELKVMMKPPAGVNGMTGIGACHRQI
jgi:hypothetical protein